MKYIAIIDDDMLNEDDKSELRVPILEKDGTSYVNLKPLVSHVLTSKDGESLYLTQEHLDCLWECSQRKAIEQVLEREEQFYDDLIDKYIAELEGERE